mgnify:CR=1 FL=1
MIHDYTFVPRAMNIKQASHYTSLSTSQILRMVDAGDIKRYRITTGRYAYLKEDLDNFLEQIKQKLDSQL